MPHYRFFIDKPIASKSRKESEPGEDRIEESILDNPAELHHLQAVMKCTIGDSVELIDGAGTLMQGSILEFGKKQKTPFCRIRIDRIEHEKPATTAVCMALALTKHAHLDYAIEKCTELGAAHFFLFASELSEPAGRLNEKNERLQHIVRSALKQSGGLFEPSIQIFPSMQEILKMPAAQFYFSDCAPTSRPAREALQEAQAAKNEKQVLFIGPEKGWSSSEREFFADNYPDRLLLLSNSTLRAETAAIIGCHEMIQRFVI